MITDKIVKGAGSHRILLALAERPRSPKELRRLVGAVNSVSRFEGEYMARLEANGYVYRDAGVWTLSVKGRQKVESLGPIERLNVAEPRTGNFKYARIERPPMLRPGADDYLTLPSRRGNRLYYRDGRIEEIK